MSHRAVLALVIPLALFSHADADNAPPSDRSSPMSFPDESAAAAWSFSNGPEWPGASGSLKWQARSGRSGGSDGCLALAYDFTSGGNYVAAITPLPTERAVVAVRLWVRKPAANQMTIRAVDSRSETFQKPLQYDYRGWQQLEVALDGWNHGWGGDGKFDPPATALHILVENVGGNDVGELLIDDVQWVYERDIADGGRTRVTYRASEFTQRDEWSASGAPETELKDGIWSYRFDDASSVSRLNCGKSALGTPQALRLSLESDGGGHELFAVLGSHFQNFERSLGRLDQRGAVTLEVPMGDMRSWKFGGGENDGIVRLPLRLLELRLERRGASADGSLRMRALEFVTERDAGRPAVVIPVGATRRDGEVEFRFSVQNLSDRELAGLMRCAFRAGAAQPQRSETPLRVAPLERAAWVVRKPLEQGSVAQADVVFAGDDFATEPVQSTLAPAPAAPAAPPPLAPQSRLGAGLYLYRYSRDPDARARMDALCRLAAAAGVRWTREEFHWNWMEPKQGEWDFRFFDQLVESATANGISIYGLMCYYTEWNKPPVTDEFIDHYCNYLRVVVGRYKDRIRHWEIWNEPNIFFWPDKPQRYPVLLARAYEAIRQADPEARVLGCSTAGIDTRFIQMVLDAKAPFDDLTIHPYRGDLDVPVFIRELSDVARLAGGRDVWITEMGWPSHVGGLTERAQAGYVARTYLAALASPVVRSVAWYDFREDGDDPFYNEHHFGLVRPDLTPKAGYAALRTIGGLFQDAQSDGVVDLATDIVALRLLRAGQPPDRAARQAAYAVWTTAAPQVARLDSGGPPLTIRSMFGDELSKSAAALQTVLLLPNEPVYVTAEADFRLRLLPGAVRAAAEPATLHPGESTRIVLESQPGIDADLPTVLPGWIATRVAGAPQIEIVPSASAAPGVYSLDVPLKCPDGVYELPVRIEIVPLLLRG